ncbi:ABC transporter ATP-binding protein [Rubritalea marina]|uniref:ABC transporter ATP-binding protein n=1 Tax=Rubritalea marina TaxID=361055 RepID=UPI00039992DD|nr:ABC transporter ATP-binding protein [Rubritalea marina]
MSKLLEVENLKMHFPVKGGVLMRQRGLVKAVDGVSFFIRPGETLGLVGESGCGKSTLGKAIVRLYDPSAGKVVFDGQDITKLGQGSLRPLRQGFQMMFQDPAESLNSRFSVAQVIREPLDIQKLGSVADRDAKVRELVEAVGLPASSVDKYPSELSGGQRQRVGVARAIALNPRLIVLDEPVSALDVSVQSQVLNLLVELQEKLDLAYLFIAHDLAVVKHISDRVAVMYLGKIVEVASSEEIYKNPKHAYTKALLSAIPQTDPERQGQRIKLEGEVPSPIDPPAGSAFGHRIKHPRYEETIGMDLALVEIAPDHWVAADPCCLSEEDWEKAQELM